MTCKADGKYWDPKLETLPASKLQELQLKRLRWTIKHSYDNNEFYRKKLKGANVAPDDIKSLDDIQKIPFLTKDELRIYYPFGLSCVPMDDIMELHASSGTTGKPVVGIYNDNDLDVWTEIMARGLYTNGMRKKDRMQNAYGYGLFTGAHGFEKGAHRIGTLVAPLSSGNTRRQVTLMKDFETTALAATPSFCLYLAEVAKEMGLEPKDDLKLKSGHFGAEAWSEEMRDLIQDTWDIEAFDHYGLTELIGPGVSTECEMHDGLHINADHFYPEVIDSKTGEVLGPNEKGELVFTSLTKQAFPAIRFRTKDLSMLITETCECGRTSPRHARIMGRADDMMKVKGVIVFPSQIEEAVMSVDGVSGNYVIVKSKKGVLTQLKVRAEPVAGTPKERFDKLANEVQQELYSILNMNVPVEIVEVGAIPRSIGKAVRVINE